MYPRDMKSRVDEMQSGALSTTSDGCRVRRSNIQVDSSHWGHDAPAWLGGDIIGSADWDIGACWLASLPDILLYFHWRYASVMGLRRKSHASISRRLRGCHFFVCLYQRFLVLYEIMSRAATM